VAMLQAGGTPPEPAEPPRVFGAAGRGSPQP
jgi:hypothetical protein